MRPKPGAHQGRTGRLGIPRSANGLGPWLVRRYGWPPGTGYDGWFRFSVRRQAWVWVGRSGGAHLRVVERSRGSRSADSHVCRIADCQSAGAWSGDGAWLRRTGAAEEVIHRRLATCETAGWAACATPTTRRRARSGVGCTRQLWHPHGGLRSVVPTVPAPTERRPPLPTILSCTHPPSGRSCPGGFAIPVYAEIGGFFDYLRCLSATC